MPPAWPILVVRCLRAHLAQAVEADRAHTSNAAEYLASSGYAGGDRYVAEPAVTDGDLITASATAPVHFAAAVFARLGLYGPEVAASWFKLYGDRDPAGYFELISV